MQLKDASGKSLLWLAVIILLAGLMVGSPSGSFFSALVSAGISLVPLMLGNPRRRIYAGAVFAVAVILAFMIYPEYCEDMERYKAAGHRQSAALFIGRPSLGGHSLNGLAGASA